MTRVINNVGTTQRKDSLFAEPAQSYAKNGITPIVLDPNPMQKATENSKVE